MMYEITFSAGNLPRQILLKDCLSLSEFLLCLTREIISLRNSGVTDFNFASYYKVDSGNSRSFRKFALRDVFMEFANA